MRALATLHTVWMYWPEDDAVELHGAIDQHTYETNPEFYAAMIRAAGKRVGGRHNIREIKIEVPWDDVLKTFDPAKIEGSVA